MKLAIHQPHYMPGPAYFHKMASADFFVFLNDAQFEKNEWQHRNRIRNASGAQWLSVPTTYKFPQKINEVEVDFSQNWQRNHFHSIEACYGKAAFYSKYAPLFAEFFCAPCSKIDRIDIDSVKLLAGILGIKTEYALTSDYKFKGESTEKLVAICKHFKATSYIADDGSGDYLNMELFEKAGIKVVFQRFNYPVYAQHWAKTPDDFIPGLSAIDLLFNCGPKSMDILMPKSPSTS
ncbi:MAG TPA: WbqC family protein [Chitinivibrionales bacterium]|nr:WbqC family protein [Chitinivibrionales bacterium]